jgi:hypothetical protein
MLFRALALAHFLAVAEGRLCLANGRKSAFLAQPLHAINLLA